MPDLSAAHVQLLEELSARGFQPIVISPYENAVGLRKGNCAALLGPSPDGRLRLLAPPAFLIEGNLSVRITRAGKQWFVWKKTEIEATPERQAELERFTAEISPLLG